MSLPRLQWPLAALLTSLIALAARPSLGDEPTNPSAAALFERLDANHDGQIAADEVPAERREMLNRLLSKADANGDGKLSLDELIAGLANKRPERPLDDKLPEGAGYGPPSPQDAEKMFSRLDRNGDGKVVADEVPEEAQPRFEKLLARADSNGDGALTKEELRASFEKLAENLKGAAAGREPKELFQYLDRNADGKLTIDEVPAERKPMFERMMKFGDRDGNGEISEQEFVAAVTQFRQRQGNAPAAEGSSGQKPASGSLPAGGNGPAGGAKAANGPNPQRFMQRMARLDKNHDGKLSREEFSGPQAQRFDRLDANHDGFVNQDEIRERMASLRDRMESARKASGGSPAAAPESP